MDPKRLPDRPDGSAERARLRRDVEVLRRRVASEWPYSPAWDAAMSALEEAERRLWNVEELARV